MGQCPQSESQSQHPSSMALEPPEVAGGKVKGSPQKTLLSEDTQPPGVTQFRIPNVNLSPESGDGTTEQLCSSLLGMNSQHGLVLPGKRGWEYQLPKVSFCRQRYLQSGGRRGQQVSS